MAAAEQSAPLLEKTAAEAQYVEGCPGCAVDRYKAAHRGIPYGSFIYVWIVTLCTALPISSLFPFLYFMIRDLNVAKRTEDIGFYAGFVGASFMFGRCLTSTAWGMAADRVGRKPVVVFGISSVVVFNTLFGLSVNYWMAITTRFLLGALNGLLGPIKAYAIEVCRPEHEALALSLVSTAWGIGLIIGPALGGYLAMPAENFPNVFSPDSIFGRFPYFLPCLCTSIFAAAVLISCIWMPETLHKHKVGENGSPNIEALEAHLIDSKETVEESGSLNTKKSLFKNWPLMSSIIIYCIFSFHDMAYTEVFSLWAESDKKYGGLSLSSEDVGQVLAVTGASLLVYQLFLYPRINKVLGPIKSSRIAAILCIPILFAYPYMTYLSEPGLSIILKCLGGLGIADLRRMGIALRVRWVWRDRRAGRPAACREPAVLDLFQAAAVISVGNGCSTFFWTDRWLGGLCIRDIAPLVYQAVPAAKKKATVAAALLNDAWVRHIKGPMTVRLLLEFGELCDRINEFTLSDIPDTFSWSLTSDRNYSSASAYGAMFFGSTPILGARQIWKTAAPPRVRFFMWLHMHGRCWTADRRFRHGLQQSNTCALCDQEPETMDHILLGCSYSKEVWQIWLGWLHLQVALPSSPELAIAWWLRVRKEIDKPFRRGVDTLFFLLSWMLWKERNNRTFNAVSRTAPLLAGLCWDEAHLWSLAGNRRLGALLARRLPSLQALSSFKIMLCLRTKEERQMDCP